jgi:hypothetical protein
MVWLQGSTDIDTVHGAVKVAVAIHRGKGGFVTVVGSEARTAETWEEAVENLSDLLKEIGKGNYHPTLV